MEYFEYIHALNKSDINRILGKLIKERRERKNLKQQDVADFLEISQAQLSFLEKGEREIGPKLLLEVMILLDFSFSDFENAIKPDVILKLEKKKRDEEMKELKRKFRIKSEEMFNLFGDYLDE